MNKIRISLLLLCIFLSAKGFAEAAKTSPKVLLSEIKKEAPCNCHKDKEQKCHLLGKVLTRSQVSYSSLKDHQLYITELENDTFVLYKKGVLDKEGISNEDMVSILVPAEEVNNNN